MFSSLVVEKSEFVEVVECVFVDGAPRYKELD